MGAHLVVPVAIVLFMLPATVGAQTGPPVSSAGGHQGMGAQHRHGAGRPQGRGGMDASRRADMQVFRYLLEHRAEIRRQVTPTTDGVTTLTESDNPDVATKVREHVRAMYARMDEGRPIHQRDPLFRELFANRALIHAEATETPKGMRVVLRSSDPYGARLARAHAEVLSLFLKNGYEEVMKDHPVPPR